MIFSVDGSIAKIKDHSKTQTRRPTDRYKVGKTYAIQPKRTKPGIPDGRILITHKRYEPKAFPWGYPITKADAQAEGGYTPEEFEALYEKMYSEWETRCAYRFKYVPTGGSE